MEDVAAHHFEKRASLPQSFRGATDNERQRAPLRPRGATGYRSIQHGKPLLLGCGSHLSRGRRIDGAAVNQQRLRTAVLQHAICTQVQAFHVATRRQHADEYVHVLGTGSCSRLTDGARHTGYEVRHQIENLYLVSSRCKVPGHRATHISQTNKTDGAHAVFSSRSCSGFCGQGASKCSLT